MIVYHNAIFNIILSHIEQPSGILNVEEQLFNIFGEKRVICCIDLIGSSMCAEKKGIVTAIKEIIEQQKRISKITSNYFGEIIKAEYDTMLVTFEYIESCLECSKEILLNNICKIGIGYGDILRDDRDAYGIEINNAYNLAEEIAKANQILISKNACSIFDTTKQFNDQYYLFDPNTYSIVPSP